MATIAIERCRTLAIATMLLFPAVSPAESIYGFEFGKPIALPECPLDAEVTRILGKKNYQITPGFTCQQQPRQVRGEPVPVIQITWAPNETPIAVKWWRAYAIELHGGLAGFHFLTNGADSQSIVLSQLTEKFGKPTDLSYERVQNRMGATFDSMTAIWRGGPVDVTLHGTAGKLDQGDVYIDTTEVTAMRRALVKSMVGPKM